MDCQIVSNFVVYWPGIVQPKRRFHIIACECTELQLMQCKLYTCEKYFRVNFAPESIHQVLLLSIALHATMTQKSVPKVARRQRNLREQAKVAWSFETGDTAVQIIALFGISWSFVSNITKISEDSNGRKEESSYSILKKSACVSFFLSLSNSCTNLWRCVVHTKR